MYTTCIINCYAFDLRVIPGGGRAMGSSVHADVYALQTRKEGLYTYLFYVFDVKCM